MVVRRRCSRPNRHFPAIRSGPTAVPVRSGKTAILHRHRCAGKAHAAPGFMCCPYALPDLSLQGRFVAA